MRWPCRITNRELYHCATVAADPKLARGAASRYSERLIGLLSNCEDAPTRRLGCWCFGAAPRIRRPTGPMSCAHAGTAQPSLWRFAPVVRAGSAAPERSVVAGMLSGSYLLLANGCTRSRRPYG